MKGLLDEYGRVLLYVVIAIILIFSIFSSLNINFSSHISAEIHRGQTPIADNNKAYITKPRPQLLVNESIKLNQGGVFDVITTPNVVAKDGNGSDIESSIQIFGEISGTKFDGNDWVSKRNITVNIPGVYTLRYSLRDSNGFYHTENIQVIVEPVIS